MQASRRLPICAAAVKFLLMQEGGSSVARLLQVMTPSGFSRLLDELQVNIVTRLPFTDRQTTLH